MRVILNIKFPTPIFNATVKDGSAGQKLNKILEAIKPEAVYFTDHHGQRSAIVIVNLADASQIPALADPWFLTFEADVQLHIAMTPPDLEKGGLGALGKQWS